MTGKSNWRAWLAFAHDVCAAAVAWTSIYWLRVSLDAIPPHPDELARSLAFILPLQAVIFLIFGLYRGLWRFASLSDLKRIVLSAGLGTVLVPLVLLLLRLEAIVPRSVLILYPLVLIFLMAGSRFAYRSWKEHRLYSPLKALGEPVLVVGAGDAGARLTKELERSRQWRVVGLLDDDSSKRGRELRGVTVLGPIGELPRWAERYGVRKVIIALPSSRHVVRRRVAELCAAAGLEALTVPSYEDLISGRSALSAIRNVELDDLLGRDPVVLDNAGLGEWLGNRVVMVTGAGGSIGAELARQIARFRPAKLVLFDVSEAALYEIVTVLADAFPQLPVASIVGDVKHAARVDSVLERERPNAIFHAAAYKHVPLMEEANAWAAVRNNAWGTWVLARAAAAARVEKFVLVSTDKAVNPTSVMGASKRLAEMVCQTLANGPTQFVIVRFGNVFGSAGSVIPRFREQIARGGPVTVTHPEITRFFMSISEATQLLLQAGLQGRDGEILVLDMGEPVRIVDLARDMIRLSGADPDKVPIVFTGLRPGEKLYEEPLASEERTKPTTHPKLFVAEARQASTDSVRQMVAWCERDRAADDAEVRARLGSWIPEYAPPAGAPVAPIPVDTAEPSAPLPLRAPRRRERGGQRRGPQGASLRDVPRSMRERRATRRRHEEELLTLALRRERTPAQRRGTEQHALHGEQQLRVGAQKEVVGQVARHETGERHQAERAQAHEDRVAGAHQPPIVRRQRPDREHEERKSDRAGLQQLAEEQVVRMRDQRVVRDLAHALGQDLQPVAVARQRPFGGAGERAAPDRRSRIDRHGFRHARARGIDRLGLLDRGVGQQHREQRDREQGDADRHRAESRPRANGAGGAHGERRQERDPHHAGVGEPRRGDRQREDERRDGDRTGPVAESRGGWPKQRERQRNDGDQPRRVHARSPVRVTRIPADR